MAKNTKGDGSLEQNGVTVVTPDNVGKGVWFNPVTQKYEVKVSGISGNLLSLRDDGLYYGTKAKPNLENLYVDIVNGVDQHPDDVQGAGTQAKPLRTIAYAMSILEYGKKHNIFLHESQDHVLNTQVADKNGEITFYAYGPKLTEYLKTAIDAIEARRHHNRDGYGPNIVLAFKTALTGTNNSYYKYGLYTFFVTGTASFIGINLVNDMNLDLPIPAGKTDVKVVNKGRIRVNGVINFNIGSLKDTGTPTVGEGVLDKVNDRWDIGMFSTERGKILLGSLHTDPNTLRSFVVADKGWDVDITADAVVNAVSYQSSIAKLIRGAVIEDLGGGAKLIKIPSTNIPTKLFI